MGEGKDFRRCAKTSSAAIFPRAGIEPCRGRLLAPEDEQVCPGNTNTAVVSYAYWQSSSAAVKWTPTSNCSSTALRQIVGVTPPRSSACGRGTVRHRVARLHAETIAANSFEVSVMGRLKPGWTRIPHRRS